MDDAGDQRLRKGTLSSSEWVDALDRHTSDASTADGFFKEDARRRRHIRCFCGDDMKGHFTLVATALCLLLGLPTVSIAQGGYFGRNKVQYREFDFKVLKTDHFDIYYYPEEEQAAQLASRMAERWYTRLSQLLNHQLSTRQPLILYASGAHFRQTNAIQGELGEGTGGVTEAFKRRIVLPFAGPIADSDHVLGHELVHAFQYDITGTNVSSGAIGALALPLWFIEGMAEYLSLGPVDPLTAMWMREATRREQLPDVDKLDNPKSSRTAMGRLSGRTSAANTATPPSATCCAPLQAAMQPTTRPSKRCCRSTPRS